MTGTAAIAAAAVAALPPLAGAHDQGDAVTISMSGATFMRAFTTSAGFSLLTPGTSMTLNSGPGGTPITYSAASGPSTSVQLAARNLGGTIDPPPGPLDPPVISANYYGLRIEWHEQGSIEGVLELINDQIGTVGSVSTSNRNATSGNPTWVNGNGFGVGGVNPVPAPPTYSTVTINGFNLSTSDYNIYANYNAAGRNLQGGQNRVQWGISDVPSVQGFSKDGAAAYTARPGTPGYGLGNSALQIDSGNPNNLQGLGVAGVRQRMNDGTVANMSTDKIDPATGSNYAAGPWNTAGIDNLKDHAVSVGGLAYVANPGTGLRRVNRSDNIWLHTTGRLGNGADFNVVTRDIYSGTANTAANNLGLDISWSTGENDDNNGNAADGGTARSRIGPEIKFSKKTSGGQQVRPTVQNSRMGFGHLSSADSVPLSKNSSSRPMRTLDFRDDADDLSNGSNNALPADLRDNKAFPDPIAGTDANLDIYNGFTRLTAKALVEGSYEARAPLTYVFVKAPNPAFAGDSPAQWAARTDVETGIKGDNSSNDVRDVRDNILNAVANFPPTSVANPADGLLQTGFLLPQFVKFVEDVDGLNSDDPNPDYNATLSGQFLGSAYATNFIVDDPASVTTGTASLYGNNNIGTGSGTPVGGSIPINAKNWLFGDFDQRSSGPGVSGKGIRDYSDLAIAQQAQAALQASGQGVSWNVNPGSNASNVGGLPAEMNDTYTKGDLIVLGDFDSDGDFDGKDLYRMARGTTLADNTGSNVLTTASGADFGDMVRKGVLRKNAALDWLQANATAQQKAEASLDGIASGDDANAFNKFDVNRDGLANRKDLQIVDHFIGQSYTDLEDQLAAVIALENGTIVDGKNIDGTAVSETPKPTSLVDVELNDAGVNLFSSSDSLTRFRNILRNDFNLLKGDLLALGSVTPGDTNLDGEVTTADIVTPINNFGFLADDPLLSQWTIGDLDGDGEVATADIVIAINDFGNLSGFGLAIVLYETLSLEDYGVGLGEDGSFVAVPEPSAIGLLALTGAMTLRRRRE